MSSALVTIKSTMMSKDVGYKYANAAFHGDERMLNVLLRKLVDQDRTISSQVQMGGVVTGVVTNASGSSIIALGFQPAYVRCMAYSGALLTSITECYSGMAMSSAILLNGNPASMTLITAQGISISSTGFKGGTSVFAANKRVNYIAMRRVGA